MEVVPVLDWPRTRTSRGTERLHCRRSMLVAGLVISAKEAIVAGCDGCYIEVVVCGCGRCSC